MYALFQEGDNKSTFHVHDAMTENCIGTFQTWGADDDDVLSNVITPLATTLIVRFEESRRG